MTSVLAILRDRRKIWYTSFLVCCFISRHFIYIIFFPLSLISFKRVKLTIFIFFCLMIEREREREQ
ncbi:uncharacterized protein BX663DRAFT_513415 [Cokeromyces recurvatus]|uniref:uncharacterized protein n=1 Tax=Cokeromyces recurvatus TaxID=90255 RepID=UPI00221EFD3A|nr:uncharacterized protein BX663DRAFT_513415 [Cokeromyces recurvatus]KAI7901598.1 hypothetical protein BX663DRAFT_513415 [Cokeromyces recurvatus]